ncbi:MAG: 3'-5' exonuclease [Gemmatimonadaceae bacterium]|nr:3'-5' exonuclease [Gemmatimonadaceae bacterium]
MSGIMERVIDETPVAIIDFETTGLSPKSLCRVVEVAVVRVNPNGGHHVVYDSLVDPGGPVACSSIHGIFDEDVVGAPSFVDVLEPLAAALRGCVVLAFNASFDMAFLHSELAFALKRSESPLRVPYGCLMYMRPAIGIGPRCGLHDAVSHHDIPAPDHRAAHDALAGALLWQVYREHMRARGIRTFGDLAARKHYKFMESWEFDPLRGDALGDVAVPASRLHSKPRVTPITYPDHDAVAAVQEAAAAEHSNRVRRRVRALRIGGYAHALVDAFADAIMTPEEFHSLERLQRELELTPGEIRSVHADFYSAVLMTCVEDGFVSHQESKNIAEVGSILRDLGWAPGDNSAPAAP